MAEQTISAGKSQGKHLYVILVTIVAWSNFLSCCFFPAFLPCGFIPLVGRKELSESKLSAGDPTSPNIYIASGEA